MILMVLSKFWGTLIKHEHPTNLIRDVWRKTIFSEFGVTDGSRLAYVYGIEN